MWSPSPRLVSATLFLFLTPSIALAQNDPASTRPTIGLTEALTRTLARNPELMALGYQIGAAEGRLQQAGIAPYPELGVSLQDFAGNDEFQRFDSAETTVAITWVLERGIRQRRVDSALANLSLRTLDVEISQLDVAAETARRFLICLAFQGRLRNAMEGVRLAEETAEAVRMRVSAGGTLEAELARAEAGLARAELLQEDYEHELLSAYHRLSSQWGVTQPDFGSVQGDVQTLPADEPFETFLARVDQNPELARFMSQQRLAEAELRVAQARSRPDWRASAGVRRVEATDDLMFVGGITIPLGTRGSNLGLLAETRANIARTEADAAAARVRLETALFVLHQELRHDLQLAARLRNDVIPRIETALVGTRRAYNLGRYSYLELSVVQGELLEANNDLLEASVDAHRLVIEIERLTGMPAAAQ